MDDRMMARLLNNRERFWVLIDAPWFGDAAFFGNWLLSAAKADRMLEQERARDPSFVDDVKILEVVYPIELSSAAMAFVGLFMANKCAFELCVIDSEWNEMFAIMAEIGFFTRLADYYKMSFPAELTVEKIKHVCRLFASTEDEGSAHPELFVDCRRHREIMQLKARRASAVA